ncbi:type II/IV secretion system ATPase TadZ/CpaE [Vibrio orientalis CIP 102891 = ATCC 33934]|uniref:Type II/IV secretion system ATPase TadZ/CpaE n=1 Tax=Vibrio orientalis CIP 102891 = ATCC 33934 TaxID=675816 RepID=C9QKY9_VIBOR|nr:AAA family ATPase [Vibrio orientalis]EEX91469.1 type II/IV secretion system ATPase TadZ/CpaE associated with Flp pilus assembly [Vibrio orientalis CIP 102891 = ATCC 33934]EGU47434.1 type II/IV secretion system ATPase TadZ/CpaE [Vibrio orientalis CIP 102891 = ATCC 33934]
MGEAVKLTPNGDSPIRLKTNLTIWVFYSSDAFHLHISHELSKCQSVNFEMISFHGLVVANLAHFSPPDLIFVETGPNWAQKIVELQQYEAPESQESAHEASLIVFGNENDNGALKIALRIGAMDFISDKAVLDELIPLLRNIAEEKVATRNLGELIVFMNTKGGAGASLIALNTAITLAKRQPDDVLLVDLDMQFGVIEDYLNVQCTYGIADAIANVADLDDVSLGSLVTKHDTGLHILGFKRENSHENFEKVNQLNKLIPVLRERYPFVIIDLSRGLDRQFGSVISPATKVFLVTQQSLVAVKNTTQVLKALTFEFGIAKDQMEVIVNRYEKRQSIKLKDIKDTVGSIKIHIVPNEFKVAIESANLGRPFIQAKKNSSMSKSVQSLADSLLPEPEEKKGWFKRMFS